MEATRSMATADSTDVPPNFMTIMLLIQESFGLHQLRVQHRGSGRAPHRIVAERHELPVENRARTQTPDESRHAALALSILARLRTVVLCHVLDRHLWSAGQIAILRQAFAKLRWR